jgi:hypothetical protein
LLLYCLARYNSVAFCAHVTVGSSAGCELWLTVGRKYIGCCHTGCCHHSTWKEACAPNSDDSEVEGAVARRAVATVAAASLATAIVAASVATASVAVAISMSISSEFGAWRPRLRRLCAASRGGTYAPEGH